MPNTKLIEFQPAERKQKRQTTSKPKQKKRADGLYQLTCTYQDNETGEKKRAFFYGHTIAEAQAKRQAFQEDLATGMNVSARDMTVAQFAEKYLKKRALIDEDRKTPAAIRDIPILPGLVDVLLFLAAQCIGTSDALPPLPDASAGASPCRPSSDVTGASPCRPSSDAPGALSTLTDQLNTQLCTAPHLLSADAPASSAPSDSLDRLSCLSSLIGRQLTGEIIQSCTNDQTIHKSTLVKMLKSFNAYLSVIRCGCAKKQIDQMNKAAFQMRPDLYSPSHPKYVWDPVNIRYHDLRHTFCTLLYNAGLFSHNIKACQYILGHSNIAVTMNIYTHLSQSHREDAFSYIRNTFQLSSKNVVNAPPTPENH